MKYEVARIIGEQLGAQALYLELISKEVHRENRVRRWRVERLDLGATKERRERWEDCCPMSSGRGSNRTCRL
jgi:hypothetical protein